MKKSLILISIIFLLFLGISAVSADNNTASVVGDKTFDAIQTALDNSNQSDTILLEGEYIGSGNVITVDKPITIQATGNGAKLNAQKNSQIFNIKSDNVVLKDLELIKGYGDTRKGHQYGGAIEASGDNLTVDNCNFISNSARYGGGIYSSGDNVEIINSRFSINTAEYTGAAFELDGNNNYVDGCIFINNEGYHAGGDVAWVGANGVLTNSKFESVKDSSKAPQFGGAVVWMGKNGRLTKSSFTGYSARNYGAAVYWKGADGNLNYCIFENNTSANDFAYWGNPSYVDCNYGGFNINSKEEFASQKLIYFDGSYASLQNWVNINVYNYSIEFRLNNGDKLSESMPNYQAHILNSTYLLVDNGFYFIKPVSIVCGDVTTYSMYDGKSVKIYLRDIENEALPSKPIQISFNGNVYNEMTGDDGAVSLKINLKNPGSYPISVIFKGDDRYGSASKSAKVTVKKQKPALTIQTKTLKAKSKTKTVKVLFKDQFKKALSKVTVKITLNKKTYTAKTNSKGIASFKVTLKAKKTYKVTAKFSGNKYYDKVSKAGSIKLK